MSDQVRNLEKIQSVIGVAYQLFEVVVEPKKLLELCYIPMGDIGNFHVGNKTVLLPIEQHEGYGRVKLDCKTFTINSVMGDKESSSPVDAITYGYPYPIVEYVTYNSMVDWENVFDAANRFIGTVRNGQFYDRNGELAGHVEAEHIKKCWSECGDRYKVPLSYRVDGCFLIFDSCHVGQVAQIKYDYLIDDEQGYPLIDENTKTAIAFYMNYTRQMRRYFQGEVPRQVMDTAEQMYSQKAAIARSRVVVNENLKAQILNIVHSYGQQGYQHNYMNPIVK